MNSFHNIFFACICITIIALGCKSPSGPKEPELEPKDPNLVLLTFFYVDSILNLEKQVSNYFQVSIDNITLDVLEGKIEAWINDGDSIRVSASIPFGSSYSQRVTLNETRLYSGEDTLRFEVPSLRVQTNVDWTVGRTMKLNYKENSPSETEEGLLTWTILEASRTPKARYLVKESWMGALRRFEDGVVVESEAMTVEHEFELIEDDLGRLIPPVNSRVKWPHSSEIISYNGYHVPTGFYVTFPQFTFNISGSHRIQSNQSQTLFQYSVPNGMLMNVSYTSSQGQFEAVSTSHNVPAYNPFYPVTILIKEKLRGYTTLNLAKSLVGATVHVNGESHITDAKGEVRINHRDGRPLQITAEMDYFRVNEVPTIFTKPTGTIAIGLIPSIVPFYDISNGTTWTFRHSTHRINSSTNEVLENTNHGWSIWTWSDLTSTDTGRRVKLTMSYFSDTLHFTNPVTHTGWLNEDEYGIISDDANDSMDWIAAYPFQGSRNAWFYLKPSIEERLVPMTEIRVRNTRNHPVYYYMPGDRCFTIQEVNRGLTYVSYQPLSPSSNVITYQAARID